MLLVATYWRTNLTMRQLAAVFGVSKSAAARVIEDLGPALGLRPRVRFPRGAVFIIDRTLVPTRDHDVAAPSKNYRYSTNHHVVIDTDAETHRRPRPAATGQPQRLPRLCRVKRSPCLPQRDGERR